MSEFCDANNKIVSIPPPEISSSTSDAEERTAHSNSNSSNSKPKKEEMTDCNDLSMLENCEFRPSLYYEKVSNWHIANSCLDYKMDLSTGINKAKFPSDIDLDNGPPERLREAIKNNTKLVSVGRGISDSKNVAKRLKTAACWGQASMIEYIIRTCYVTENEALPALAYASILGSEECVSVLLKSGLSPSSLISDTNLGKNSFMLACEHGQEACASLLLAAMKDINQVFMKTAFGLTAFDILRNNDMNGIARRLDDQAKLQFPK